MFLQRPDNHAFRQRGLWYSLTSYLLLLTSIIEPVVHHEIQGCREVGHVTAEGIVGVYGNLQTVQVQPIVGLEERLHIRIFIALHLPGRESILLKPFEGSVTLGIHHFRRMLENHLATLFIQLYVLLFTTH